MAEESNKMPFCPMLKEECIRESCSWWYKKGPVDSDKCWIPLLALSNLELVLEIRRLRKDVCKELVETYNELVDIENKLGKK